MQTIRERTFSENFGIRKEIRKAYQHVSERHGTPLSSYYGLFIIDMSMHIRENFAHQTTAKPRGKNSSSEISGDRSLSEGDQVTRRGMEIYENRLKSKLEPEFNGQSVAIHIGSGDYEVADSSGNAMRAIRKRYPSGPLLLRTIGTVSDFGLAARMSGKRIVGQTR